MGGFGWVGGRKYFGGSGCGQSGAVGTPLGPGAGVEVRSRVLPGPAQPAEIGIGLRVCGAAWRRALRAGSMGTSLLRAEGCGAATWAEVPTAPIKPLGMRQHPVLITCRPFGGTVCSSSPACSAPKALPHVMYHEARPQQLPHCPKLLYLSCTGVHSKEPGSAQSSRAMPLHPPGRAPRHATQLCLGQCHGTGTGAS